MAGIGPLGVTGARGFLSSVAHFLVQTVLFADGRRRGSWLGKSRYQRKGLWDKNISSTHDGSHCGVGNSVQEPTSCIVLLSSGKERDACEGGSLMIAEYLRALPGAAAPVGICFCTTHSSTARTSWLTGVFTISAPTTTTCAASSPET